MYTFSEEPKGKQHFHFYTLLYSFQKDSMFDDDDDNEGTETVAVTTSFIPVGKPNSLNKLNWMQLKSP